MFKPSQPPPRMDTLLIAGTHALAHAALLAPEPRSHSRALLPSRERSFCFAIISSLSGYYIRLTLLAPSPTPTAHFVAVSSCLLLLPSGPPGS